jgi:soluble lytic murein transglycosylase
LLLQELDATKYTKDIIKHLAKLNIEKGSEVLAAKLSTKIARYDFAIQVSKQASYQKRFYNKFNYPIITVPRKVNNKEMPKPELILAIIRQESEFDLKANSYVGARGMMQLMKYTAKLVAKQAKLPYSLSRLTEDPEYNIKLGSYYFSTLLENYNGVYPFAIAAYNAGPNRVKTWRKINGDPSKGQLSYVDWIELIRFKETRNYVQRVLENANVYKYMINGSSVKINGFVRKY